MGRSSIAVCLAWVIVGSSWAQAPSDGLLGELIDSVGLTEEEADLVSPELDRWLASGGDVDRARALLVVGINLGCADACVPSLVRGANLARAAGMPHEGINAMVIHALGDAMWFKGHTRERVVDAEIGRMVEEGVAVRIAVLTDASADSKE